MKFVLFCLLFAAVSLPASAGERPLLFPLPSETRMGEGRFTLDSSATLLLPAQAVPADESLARLFRHDLIDRFGRALDVVRTSRPGNEGKFILIGTAANPLVRGYCTNHALLPALKAAGPEGYLLVVTDKEAVVAANTRGGALYGTESLRQLVRSEDGTLSLPRLTVRDHPRYPFRGIKLYLPGRDNIAFFKRFIRDFVAQFKFNKVILELNANMRLDRHPELNIGAVQFFRHLNQSRLGRPPGAHKEYQNSSHQDNADGGILEKEEVADLVRYMRQYQIEVIPELPSLTHSYYLLAGHKDLAENPNQEYPDTYCPLKPGSYKLYFDVLDEYIDVIHPKMIHIGHDEWRMEKDVCPLCRGKDYNELYAKDLNTIYSYLTKRKGVQVAIWGDHLLESVYGKDHQLWKTSTGYQYKIPASLPPEQVEKLIPKDILIFNWFWSDINNDRQLARFGFRQVYGNLRPDIAQWADRAGIKGVLGGAPSSWAGTTEMNFGKDQLYDFLSAANLLWSTRDVPPDSLALMTEPLSGSLRTAFRGVVRPSEMGYRVTPLDITSQRNSSLAAGPDSVDAPFLASGALRSGNVTYEIPPPSADGRKAVVASIRSGEPPAAAEIAVGGDVGSIMFLHACAREAVNRKAYDLIFNFDDTAELLGWYDVVFEDGFVETVPVRYGVNILDWRWRQRILGNEKEKLKYSQNRYAYAAAAVDCSVDPRHPVTFFSYEWENSRPGKKIRHVTLHAAEPAKRSGNAIILLAVSVSGAKKAQEAKGNEAQ